MLSIFEPVELLPEDPILSIPLTFAADAHPKKINLGIGVYKNADGEDFILSAIKKAEKSILETAKSKNYFPIDGNPAYLNAVKKLVFGVDSKIPEDLLYASQSVGGTGAISLASTFLLNTEHSNIAISDPSWLITY